MRPYLRLQLRARNRMDTAFQEQAAILRSITAGDAQAATEALRQHAMVQGDRLGDLLASLASLPPSAEA